MTETLDGYLLVFFRSEETEDGEQVRFAVSADSTPTGWIELNAGAPILTSRLGECGVRDPFIVRDERRDRFVLMATDLRTWPDHDWNRATRHGSRSILVWESTDLVDWGDPRLVDVAPEEAGNTWAPKAFWSEVKQRWLVFWASALFPPDTPRAPGTYQRILVAETEDFRRFSPARVHLDLGHDVIDLTFASDGRQWYRFSANAHVPGGHPDIGHHIFMERGPELEEPRYGALTIDIGKDVMRRAEGPAVTRAVDGGGWYLLADEFGLRGYQLFHADDLATGQWTHLPDASLPPGARHGSLLPISGGERDRMLEHAW
ncbi:hypothetical protein GCM10027568_31180 [Humibacter soli]